MKIGWSDKIAEVVKRMVSPDILPKQLMPVIKLGQLFLDVNCVEGARMIKESIASSIGPRPSWRQPNAVLPDHPEVETFLRSPHQVLIYAKFSGIGEARRFATKLEKMGPSSGFSVAVTASGVGKLARCEITKKRITPDLATQGVQANATEWEELTKLQLRLQGLNVAMEGAGPSDCTSGVKTSGEIEILHPSKRMKPDNNVP